MIRRIKRTFKRWVSALVHSSDWSLDSLPGVVRCRGWLLRLAQVSTRWGVGTSLTRWKRAWLPICGGVRQLALGSTALVSVGLVAVVMFQPVRLPGRTESYQFPDPPILSGWELVDASRDPGDVPRAPRAQAISRYSYAKDQWTLDVEVRYFAEANGDVVGYAQARLDVLPAVQFIGQAGLGNYILFEHADQLWLSACIDPRGVVTASRAQFRHNRRVQDRTMPRLLAWIFGVGRLEDRRVVWTLMAIPLGAKEREETVEQLAGAIREWADWDWIE
jgi:cyanosortase A-associated protein